jgi:hypothetical protein
VEEHYKLRVTTTSIQIIKFKSAPSLYSKRYMFLISSNPRFLSSLRYN